MKHQTSRDPKRLCDCDRCMSALHSEIGANPYLNKKLYRRQPRAAQVYASIKDPTNGR